MARTPLFRLLQRSYALARRSERTGVPVDEIVDRDRRGRLSRREFLAHTGVVASALSVGGCASLARRGQAREPQVVIVGAGLAGLTAAYRLRRAGVRVRVIEAQERTGGRCYSLRGHFPDGQVAELGGELIDTGHTHIQALAREFEIPLDDLAEADTGLDTETWYFDGRRFTHDEVAEAFSTLAPRIKTDLDSIGGDGAVSYRTPLGAEALDRMTLAEWLDRAELAAWFRRLLEVAYVTEYGLETGDQSALNLLLLIGPPNGEFHVFGASDERYHVQGGNDRIVRELSSRVGAVDRGTVLEALRERADGFVELDVRTAGVSSTLAAPHVILAIPFTVLRHVTIGLELPEAKRRAIAELGYGTNAKLMMGFTARPWRVAHKSNGSVFSDAEFQCVWETSRAQPGASGILTNFTGGRHGVAVGQFAAGEQGLRIVSTLESLFPGLAATRITGRDVRFHWPSHQWTKGSYASYLPGQWTTIHGAEGERVKNVHFAGEHCSLDAQGFMEGAVETGEAAAREVLADLGIQAPAPQTRAVPTGTGQLAWERRQLVTV